MLRINKKKKNLPKSSIANVTKILETPTKRSSFPIIGVGGSAGGMEAFRELLNTLSTHGSIAIVFVQHLSPSHKSLLASLLTGATPLPVIEVKNGMRVEPNHIYIIPANYNMILVDGVFKLTGRDALTKHFMPIDIFFQSLAEERKSQAIGVILSGTASDGTLGLKAIKAEGGITFAQDPKTAKFDGMPRNAIMAGCVDFILSPKEISRELNMIALHPYMNYAKLAKIDQLITMTDNDLNTIFGILRNKMGVDFSFYKHSTIKRRIVRRLVLHKKENLADYVNLLKTDQSEVENLFDDILINVTGFFRDPKSHEILNKIVFPSIMKERYPEEPIRIWVCGCSTGEETYSVTMSLLEYLGDKGRAMPIQIFATDVSDRSLEKARQGVYPASAVVSVPQELLRRYFIKMDDGNYKIVKHIRDLCIFARQNVVQDPPFSNLDLISCRNVLIYLGPILQKKIIPTFHYALKPKGFLLLGTSESIGEFASLFHMVDRKQKFYAKRYVPTRPDLNFTHRIKAQEEVVGKKDTIKKEQDFNVEDEANRIILNKFVPSGIIVNADLEVIQFRGETVPYLKPPVGKATFNILKLAKEGILLELRTALYKAKKKNIVVKKEGVRFRSGDETRTIDIEVYPIIRPTMKENFYLVIFNDWQIESARHTPSVSEKTPLVPPKGFKNRELQHLERELVNTKEYLQAIIEEQEQTNEELKSANEEIQSGNEELQSTNEELETAKEELQSTNEELMTLNEELQNRNVELSLVNNDMSNLLASIHMPIIMLGNDLRIRRITPSVERIFNIMPTDIGRPITDLKLKVDIPEIEQSLQEVLDTFTVKEFEVQDQKGHWYSVLIRPYKTFENKIDGVVIVLIDIDMIKSAFEETKAARNYAVNIIETVQQPLVVLNENLRIVSVNKAFQDTFRSDSKEDASRLLEELGGQKIDDETLRSVLLRIIPENREIKDVEITRNFRIIGDRTFLINARKIQEHVPHKTLANREESEKFILLLITDITGHKRSEIEMKHVYAQLKESQLQLIQNTKLTAIGQLAAGVAHELNSPLAGLVSMIKVQKKRVQNKSEEKDFNLMFEATQHMAKIVSDLNSFARESSNEFTDCDLNEIIESTLSFSENQLEGRNIKLKKEFAKDLPKVKGDRTQLQQVVLNFLTNARDAIGEDGQLTIKTSRFDAHARMEFIDTGVGIKKEDLPKIFDPFFSTKGQGKGVGLGLSVTYGIVQNHSGKINVESEPGKGAKFTVLLPMMKK